MPSFIAFKLKLDRPIEMKTTTMISLIMPQGPVSMCTKKQEPMSLNKCQTNQTVWNSHVLGSRIDPSVN